MYYILHKDGKLVGVSLAEPIPELFEVGIIAEGIDEECPDLNRVLYNPETNSLERSSVKSKLEFMQLFTSAERMKIDATDDPIVHDIMGLFNAAQVIDMNYPDTVQAIYYFASKGLIAETRIIEILKG